MAYLGSLAQVWSALQEAGMDDMAHNLKVEAEAMLANYAEQLAHKLGVKAGSADMDHHELGGLCVVFYPAHEGQPLPQVFEEVGMDTPSEWGE
jgi:hypothetical protein